MSSTVPRLQVVDALRGFAIVSIILLHNIEHYDLYYLPSNLPNWIRTFDSGIWKSLFFLFSGKSYAIFSLLFGLTFFIQSNNQEIKGKDFRARFVWRLFLLFIFGLINSAFYQGDILTDYAVIGLFLIPVARLNDKAVFWIALVLMFQPYEWINFILAVQNPDIKIVDPASWFYFDKMGEYITGNSLIETWIGNLTNGKTAVFYWTWENGRIFQTLSLFMLGMLAGRKSVFVASIESKRFWFRTIIISFMLFLLLFTVKEGLNSWISNKAIRSPIVTIETSWTNMAFMLVMVSGFVLLFQTDFFYKLLNSFSSIGRMSLSNYIMMSIIGSFIYYGFGLGLYQYAGATYSLFIGILLAMLEGFFSSCWINRFNHGPLETIWHKMTWIGST
ncbi:hypothetical protein AQPE_0285 [Aquipluma nitroreducens]|uniref:DUF418 domain-containing protein n=1 Tax=Aquipluma nitroreducens TaxID=2010828 RepID=A0A5K7S3J4_9BACT|nr:DUF418 domain-containing protein [Aquipluma nitroreducens]BBE16148.1 hypothetical protein AQPE_0285 [Aquipluma nitroreducens]